MLMVDKLVKEHNKTPEQIYLTNYIDCLNWLSLYRQREDYIEQENKNRNKRR
jgi:sulfur relay (sulfurtransferase) DsrF/TusC family protein